MNERIPAKRKYKKRRFGEAMAEVMVRYAERMTPMPADFEPTITVKDGMLIAKWRGAAISVPLKDHPVMGVDPIHAMKLSLWQAHEAYRLGYRE